MSIQKKSLINSRTATQKAIIASTRLVAPVVSNRVSVSKVSAAKVSLSKVGASKVGHTIGSKVGSRVAAKTLNKAAK